MPLFPRVTPAQQAAISLQMAAEAHSNLSNGQLIDLFQMELTARSFSSRQLEILSNEIGRLAHEKARAE
jgi:hypothetical protein